MAVNHPVPVADGIWRLPITLPGHSVGHVNVYILSTPNGVLLVDTAWASNELNWTTIDVALRQIGFSTTAIERILLTHHHPDHCGLAGQLQERTGAPVTFHPHDQHIYAQRYVNVASYESMIAQWIREMGAPPSFVDIAETHAREVASKVSLLNARHVTYEEKYTLQAPWDITTIHTPGHTPGHVCYYESTTGSLFSGDHVLPSLNTGPSFRPPSSSDPVGDYFKSLRQLEDLEIGTVFPGHQSPFRDLGPRIAALRTHHKKRLRQVLELAAIGHRTVFQISSQVPRSRSWSSLPVPAQISAMAETYAHLLHLTSTDQVTIQLGLPRIWTT